MAVPERSERAPGIQLDVLPGYAEPGFSMPVCSGMGEQEITVFPKIRFSWSPIPFESGVEKTGSAYSEKMAFEGHLVLHL